MRQTQKSTSFALRLQFIEAANPQIKSARWVITPTGLSCTYTYEYSYPYRIRRRLARRVVRFSKRSARHRCGRRPSA